MQVSEAHALQLLHWRLKVGTARLPYQFAATSCSRAWSIAAKGEKENGRSQKCTASIPTDMQAGRHGALTAPPKKPRVSPRALEERAFEAQPPGSSPQQARRRPSTTAAAAARPVPPAGNPAALSMHFRDFIHHSSSLRMSAMWCRMDSSSASSLTCRSRSVPGRAKRSDRGAVVGGWVGA